MQNKEEFILYNLKDYPIWISCEALWVLETYICGCLGGKGSCLWS